MTTTHYTAAQVIQEARSLVQLAEMRKCEIADVIAFYQHERTQLGQRVRAFRDAAQNAGKSFADYADQIVEAGMPTYRDKQGRVLFVSDGISDGKAWGTFYRKASGGMKRVKSPNLPMRSGPVGRAAAQNDLDLYAMRHGMQLHEEGSI